MKKGFIYDHNKCVGCGACSAACIIENDWSIKPRMIYTYNSEVLPSLALYNLSLACNHCKKPVCLEGCPSGSFYTESFTGAIVLNDKKCLGCRYCQWNCPYDAPKYDEETGVVGKCHLCWSGLIDGRSPACTNGCPTGALKFGEINETANPNLPLWFPDKNLTPSLEFKGEQDPVPLRIIPEMILDGGSQLSAVNKKVMKGVWSLVLFSFLTTLSVSLLISSLIRGIFPDQTLFAFLILIAGVSSLFHLGKVSRAWRAVSNPVTSPLSREIAAFIVFTVVSFIAVFLRLPAVLIAASVAGVCLLILIDNVYIYTDRRKKIIFHSGQTFLSSLLIISFLTDSVFPFVFIGILKLASLVYGISVIPKNDNSFNIRFFRIAFLIITAICIVTGISRSDPAVISLFLAGEIFDRIIYYIDFAPMNLNTSMNNHLTAEKNEKKRG